MFESQLHVEDLKEKILQQEAFIAQLQAENARLKKTQTPELIPLQEIISRMPGNVFWKDRNHVYLGCNNNVARLIGCDHPEQIVGKRNADFEFLKPYAERLENIDEQIMASNMGQFLEEPAKDENGHDAIYYSHKMPLSNEAGEVVGLLGIALNITHQKKIERELKIAKEEAEAASHAKSEFIANMSHDMKTPLAGIISISELLTYRLQEESLEFAQTLLNAGQQLMNFFDNCLEIFKLDNNPLKLTQEHFNITHVLRDIRYLFEPAIKAKELTLNIDIDHDGPCSFYGSRTGIYRCILNLVANAVKFTDSGAITIEAAAKKVSQSYADLTISITDTGIGIPEEKQRIIFEQFTRLVPSYKGIYEGSGMGLYIVKKLIQAMKGKIHVDSSETKGSTFTFSVRLEVVHLKMINLRRREQLSNQKEEININQKPIKLLLVEDNLITQRMQTSLLNSLKYEVMVASSGEKALELFKSGQFDLIFLDIGLPGISGEVVSKSIREMEKNSAHRVPIVALTAHLTAEVESYCRAAQIDAVYSKPLSREQAKFLIERFVLKKFNSLPNY